MKNFCEDLFFFFFFFFLEIAGKIFVKTFFFFFGEHLRFVSLVLGLGLEHSCPWPRECLSSERLSLALALASDFFCVLGLGLEPCVLDSTSACYVINELLMQETDMSVKLVANILQESSVLQVTNVLQKNIKWKKTANRRNGTAFKIKKTNNCIYSIQSCYKARNR